METSLDRSIVEFDAFDWHQYKLGKREHGHRGAFTAYIAGIVVSIVLYFAFRILLPIDVGPSNLVMFVPELTSFSWIGGMLLMAHSEFNSNHFRLQRVSANVGGLLVFFSHTPKPLENYVHTDIQMEWSDISSVERCHEDQDADSDEVFCISVNFKRAFYLDEISMKLHFSSVQEMDLKFQSLYEIASKQSTCHRDLDRITFN